MPYSEDFRKELLDAFFDSGQSIRRFAIDYGMNKNTLYAWAKVDPRYVVVKKSASWRRYTPEYKYKAIQMVIVEGLSTRKTAEIMGCKYGALVSTWVRAYKEKGVIGLEPPEEPIGRKKPETQKAEESNAPTLEEYVRELEAKNDKLEKENRRLKFEADVAHAIVKVRSKKEEGLDVSLLLNKEKTAIVDSLRPRYLLKELLEYLQLSASSYEYRKQIEGRPDKYAEEREVIIEAFLESNGIYGYRRVTVAANKGIVRRPISERVVRRIMNEEDLRAKQSKKNPYSSYKGETGNIARNIINREFGSEKPLSKVSTDVTEFKIAEQKIYLSPLIDLFSGEVISYSAGQHPTVKFVMDMFDEKTKALLKNAASLAHSDQGFQYQHVAYRSVLEELSCQQSMSRKGNCLDNSPVESFFARLKVEFYHDAKFASVKEFYQKLDEYIWWYNNKRIKMRLGGMSPVEYREAYLKAAS